MSDVVVAGAGRTGILVSRMLAERGIGVTLVERLPAPGGQEPETDAAQLARAASRAGVRMMLAMFARPAPEGGDALIGALDGPTEAEIPFLPGRVLMHDTTCGPALVDIAGLRATLAEAGTAA